MCVNASGGSVSTDSVIHASSNTVCDTVPRVAKSWSPSKRIFWPENTSDFFTYCQPYCQPFLVPGGHFCADLLVWAHRIMR